SVRIKLCGSEKSERRYYAVLRSSFEYEQALFMSRQSLMPMLLCSFSICLSIYRSVFGLMVMALSTTICLGAYWVDSSLVRDTKDMSWSRMVLWSSILRLLMILLIVVI